MISAHLIISINITAIIGCSSPPKVQLTISQKKTGAGLLRPGVWIQNPRVIWVWWSPSMRKRWWVLDGPKGRKSVAMVQPRASQGKCQRRKSQKKMRERRWSRRTWRSWKILRTCWSSWRVAGGALQVVEDESDCWGFCSARSQRSVWNLAKPKQGWWWMHVDASSLAGCKTQFSNLMDRDWRSAKILSFTRQMTTGLGTRLPSMEEQDRRFHGFGAWPELRFAAEWLADSNLNVDLKRCTVYSCRVWMLLASGCTMVLGRGILSKRMRDSKL